MSRSAYPARTTSAPSSGLDLSSRRNSTASLHPPLVEAEVEAEGGEPTSPATNQQPTSATAATEGDQTPTPGSPELRRRSVTADPLPNDLPYRFTQPPPSPGLQFNLGGNSSASRMVRVPKVNGG